MNTAEPGSLLEKGLILKSIKELAPPLSKTYDTNEERMKDLLQVFTKLVSDMYIPMTTMKN